MNVKKTVALAVGVIVLAAALVFAGIGIHSTYAASHSEPAVSEECGGCCK